MKKFDRAERLMLIFSLILLGVPGLYLGILWLYENAQMRILKSYPNQFTTWEEFVHSQETPDDNPGKQIQFQLTATQISELHPLYGTPPFTLFAPQVKSTVLSLTESASRLSVYGELDKVIQDGDIQLEETTHILGKMLSMQQERINASLLRHDTAEAVRVFLDSEWLIRQNMRKGTLSASDIAIRLARMRLRNSLSMILSFGSPTEEELRKIMVSLERQSAFMQDEIKRCIQGESLYFSEFDICHDSFYGDDWVWWQKLLFSKGSPYMKMGSLQLLENYRFLYDNVDREYWEWKDKMDAKIAKQLAPISFCGLQSFDYYMIWQAYNRVYRTVIAVLLFEKRYGRLPDSLEALVPEFLPGIPRDPFTGTSLHYRSSAACPVLFHFLSKEYTDDSEFLMKVMEVPAVCVYSFGVPGKDMGGLNYHLSGKGAYIRHDREINLSGIVIRGRTLEELEKLLTETSHNHEKKASSSSGSSLFGKASQ